jgi:simple sugar transport system ATP-binding protein
VQLRSQGVGIVFITHNVRHALAVGDRFTVLNRGRTIGTLVRNCTSRAELEDMMAGGRELANLTEELGTQLASEL